MNDIEFETMARRAAAAVRTEADQIADSRSALATLLATDGRQLAEDPETPTVVGLSDRTGRTERPGRRRPAWMPILAAAAAVAAVAGIVIVVARDDEPGTVVTTEPTVPEVTAPDAATDPSTVPDAAPPAPSTITPTTPTTTPPTTASAPATIDEPIVLPDDRGEPLARTVLATYTIGDGDGQLGVEDCQECEPLRPWPPVVTADGTVFVADAANERWQIYRDGAWSAFPYRPGEVVAAAPVVGPDGAIYAAVADALAPSNPRRIVAYLPTSLEAIATYDVDASRALVVNSVDLVGDALRFGFTEVLRFDVPLGTPTWQVDVETNEVTVSLSGVQRRFRLPDTWSLRLDGTAALADGSFGLQAFARNDDDSGEWSIVRLWADGSFATGRIDADPATTNLDGRFGPDGWVQLEDAVVVYALPEFVGPDPLAGWVIPEFDAPDVATAPRLLPVSAIGGNVTTTRRESADVLAERFTYSQTWVRADAAGVVDGITRIFTEFGPSPIGLPADDGEVEIDGWARSYFVQTSPDVASLTLHTARRTMTVWASGLGRDDVLAIAESLRVDGDGSGWQTPVLPEPGRWTAVHEGWTSGAASRSLRQQPADAGDHLEMWTVSGLPDAIATPGLLWNEISLADIGGHPALLFEGDGRSGVTWSPADDVVVVLGSFGPIEQLVAIAESVRPVDEATWEAASILDDTPGDGCDSIFC